jgi:hypothetical protein
LVVKLNFKNIVDFLDPNIQYRKRAGCSKTNIPLGHYGYGCA